MTNVKKDSAVGLRQDQVIQSGLQVQAFPGLAGLRVDQYPHLIMSTELVWGSLATRSSRRVVPFNFRIVEMMSILRTAPVGSNAKRLFQIGTSTSAGLFFSTKASFNSSSALGRKRLMTATDVSTAYSANASTCSSAGTAGMLFQFTLKPTATVLSTAGSIIGIAVVVPR